MKIDRQELELYGDPGLTIRLAEGVNETDYQMEPESLSPEPIQLRFEPLRLIDKAILFYEHHKRRTKTLGGLVMATTGIALSAAVVAHKH